MKLCIALISIISSLAIDLSDGFTINQRHGKSWSSSFLKSDSATINKKCSSAHLLQLTDDYAAKEGLTSDSTSIIEFGPKIQYRSFQKAALKYFNRDLLELAKKSSAATTHDSRFAKQAYDTLLLALFASDEVRLHLELPIPSSMSFGAVLDALSTSGLPEAPFYAETLMSYMEQMSTSGYKECSPNSICYNSALTCWARSFHPEAGFYADALLSRMEKFVCPDRITYTTTIRAWANASNNNQIHQITSIQRRKTKDVLYVAQRAEDILLKMEHMYFEEGKQEMKPDEYTYSTAIDAVGKSGEPGAAQRAETILRRMEKLHESGKTQVSPTHVTYTAVIDAYAKQCSSSSSMADAESAEALLKQMEDAHAKDGINASIRPNKISYTAVIDAFGKCGVEGSAKRAEAVLRRMQLKYEEGDETVRPNAITYAVVINAYAKSNGTENKAQKAFDVLNRMHTLYHTTKDANFQPNTFTYTSCLNACAFTSAQEERPIALNLLHLTMNDFETSIYCEPNNRSYATYLRGLSNLMAVGDNERDIFAKATFENCCKRGEVDYIVLENMRFASNRVYTQQLGHLSKVPINMLSLRDLPADWSRSVANPVRRGQAPFRATTTSKTSIRSPSQVLSDDVLE